MTTKLPTKLGKEPLIDVVCGVSFDCDIPAETLLPGLLLPKLAGQPTKFESLPIAQLSQFVRDSDPNLKNAPLMRIVIGEKFTVLIGSQWLGVGCQMPYAGWSDFKEMIITVFAVLIDLHSIKGINRHSLKYADFIKSQNSAESLSRFNLEIKIASRTLSDQLTHLRTEIIEHPFLHATTIMYPATVASDDGTLINGALVDVDTHRLESFTVNDFLKQLPELLDEIHTVNKTFFFDLLSEAGLKELEPVYE
jgi:uncharacterized protein (TIGR04255 family)